MTNINMDVPVKYPHRITRTKSVSVPCTFKDLPELRKVLYLTLCVKAIVLETQRLLQTQDNDQDDLDDVMEPPNEDTYQLPDTFSSQ